MLFFVHKIYCHSTAVLILLSIFLLRLSHVWLFSAFSILFVSSNATFHISQNCLVKRFSKSQVAITTVTLCQPRLYHHLHTISSRSPCDRFQNYRDNLREWGATAFAHLVASSAATQAKKPHYNILLWDWVNFVEKLLRVSVILGDFCKKTGH